MGRKLGSRLKVFRLKAEGMKRHNHREYRGPQRKIFPSPSVSSVVSNFLGA
jgi:hypothetical protein